MDGKNDRFFPCGVGEGDGDEEEQEFRPIMKYEDGSGCGGASTFGIRGVGGALEVEVVDLRSM